MGYVVWLGYTARPPPPVVLPARLSLRSGLPARCAGLRPSGSRLPRVVWGVVVNGMRSLVWLHRPPTPTRNPPCAAGASPRLAGAFRAGLRPSGSRWAACGVVGVRDSDVRRAEKTRYVLESASPVTSGHACNSRHLARAPRGGLRGLSPQVHPATFASRPIRRKRVSRFFGPPTTALPRMV